MQFSTKKMGVNFFFEKMPNWGGGGGPRGVWQKTRLFPVFFSHPSLIAMSEWCGLHSGGTGAAKKELKPAPLAADLCTACTLSLGLPVQCHNSAKWQGRNPAKTYTYKYTRPFTIDIYLIYIGHQVSFIAFCTNTSPPTVHSVSVQWDSWGLTKWQGKQLKTNDAAWWWRSDDMWEAGGIT